MCGPRRATTDGETSECLLSHPVNHGVREVVGNEDGTHHRVVPVGVLTLHPIDVLHDLVDVLRDCFILLQLADQVTGNRRSVSRERSLAEQVHLVGVVDRLEWRGHHLV